MDKDEKLNTDWKKQMRPLNGSLNRDSADSNENEITTSKYNNSLRLNNNSSGHGGDTVSCEFCNLSSNRMSRNEKTNLYGVNDDYNVKVNNTDAGTSGNLNNIESEIVSNGRSIEKPNHSDYNINVPSGSGANGHRSSESSLEKEAKCAKPAKPNRKRPLRKKRANVTDADSSSDTGNDDYSLGSEDGCIYTYRGGEHLADLPSSFFSLDMGLEADNSHLPAPPLFGVRPEPLPEVRASGASSPDMDYLEMDFDPGPSCEVDTNDESSLDLDLDAVSAPKSVNNLEVNEPPPPKENPPTEAYNINDQPSTSKQCLVESPEPERNLSEPNVPEPDVPVPDPKPSADVAQDEPVYSLKGSLIPHTTVSGEVIYVRRTTVDWPTHWEVDYHHNTTGDLISPSEGYEGELQESSAGWSYPNKPGSSTNEHPNTLGADRVNLSSTLFHCTMAKKLVVERQSATFLQDRDNSNEDGPCREECGTPARVPRSMLWSETEACSKQTTQLGTSACGASAVANALMALQNVVDVELVLASVKTRQRATVEASLARYLLSRSVAGCTADDLISGLNIASQGRVLARFFPTWPLRSFSLSHWLAYWITLGAVPIATLNLQSSVSDPSRIPDSWHHQMIFGVSERGVFLANPLQCVSEGALWAGLCSDSVLLVRRKDVLSRWRPHSDIGPLMTVPGDERWASMNVVGQVVSAVREDRSSMSPSRSASGFVRVPAAYRAGISLAALVGSEAHRRLLRAHQLPLFAPDDDEPH